VVIHVIAEQATVEGRGESPGSQIGPDGLLPPELIAELAKTAKLRPLIHPLDAAAEPAYIPSCALADYVRCRDLTCRFPGCDHPAMDCDIDHTIPHADNGPTHASNLKCLCRLHHLAKTFWGWHDRQLRDGTVIWTSPVGETFVSTPGSALLFPSLCAPTGTLTPQKPGLFCGNREAMMPRRTRTRTQDRAARIATERKRNRSIGCGGAPVKTTGTIDVHPDNDSDPPPF
jgi:hypothetical protein